MEGFSGVLRAVISENLDSQGLNGSEQVQELAAVHSAVSAGLWLVLTATEMRFLSLWSQPFHWVLGSSSQNWALPDSSECCCTVLAAGCQPWLWLCMVLSSDCQPGADRSLAGAQMLSVPCVVSPERGRVMGLLLLRGSDSIYRVNLRVLLGFSAALSHSSSFSSLSMLQLPLSGFRRCCSNGSQPCPRLL